MPTRIVPDPNPVEPAHPMVVKFHDELVTLYKLIREKYQKEIDAVFDGVSRDIGYVVATTLPVELEVNDEGRIAAIRMGAPHLKDTLFDRRMSEALGPILDDPVPVGPPGKFNIYLLWYEALKLKLRTEWIEPAHFRRRVLFPRERLSELELVPGVREPAHWFDPGLALDPEELVLIAAIDDVYPELRLADRVQLSRRGMGSMAERPAAESEVVNREALILEELQALLNRHGR